MSLTKMETASSRLLNSGISDGDGDGDMVTW